MDIGIMVEGQNGLDWPRWKNIVAAVEDLGFYGLYRSDHFTNNSAPDKDSLELWVSLTWLACNTRRIQFGPLVTPLSFRSPVFTARMASAIDDLSGGRLTLGLGAGWQEREHLIYGFDLLDIGSRFDRFEEGLRLIQLLFDNDESFTFEGTFFQANGAILLPRPGRIGGPPILIGGNGIKRTFPLAAQFAREWNSIFLGPEKFLDLNNKMDKYLRSRGRLPKSLTRSMMTGLRFARTHEELEIKLAEGNQSAIDLIKKGIIVAAGDEIKLQLLELEKAGLQRIMLQWLDLDDLNGLAELAKIVF